MRRSASEVIRNLESRIARLERKAGKSDLAFRGVGMDYLDRYLVKVDDLDNTLDARKARNSQKMVEHELITKNKI